MLPDPLPGQFLLQWHLSDACNLRCQHCYQESYRQAERGLGDWLALLQDFKALLRVGQGRRGHINVTGGEPFALRDFPALLDAFACQRDALSFAILSNGTLIDAALARALRHWQVAWVQVSIDGSPATHDHIRGAGSHARAVAGIEALNAAGVSCVLSFTAQPDNYREFAEVARLGQSLGVSRVWSDRVIPPPGRTDLALSVAQTTEYLQIMAAARAATPKRCRTEISQHRALQFLHGGQSVYHCTAGDTLLTVMPDGSLYPCRRLPIPSGNVYQDSLLNLYQGETLRALRRGREFAGCEDCSFVSVCQGGLRCLAYALHGRLDVADPACPLATPYSAGKVIPLHRVD